MCVLGYCVFPVNLTALVIALTKALWLPWLVKLGIVAVGFLWSTVCKESTTIPIIPLDFCSISWLYGSTSKRGEEGAGSLSGVSVLPVPQLVCSCCMRDFRKYINMIIILQTSSPLHSLWV